MLDTNYLIGALVPGSPAAERVVAWYGVEELCASAVAWYEFLSGPVPPAGVEIMEALLADRVIPYTADQAAEAARLFNAVGRPRRLRVDAMVAAAAIVGNAALATANGADFAAFRPYGLRLA